MISHPERFQQGDREWMHPFWQKILKTTLKSLSIIKFESVLQIGGSKKKRVLLPLKAKELNLNIDPRQSHSKIKMMLTAVFDHRIVVHYEVLPPGETLNKKYYLTLRITLKATKRFWKDKSKLTFVLPFEHSSILKI